MPVAEERARSSIKETPKDMDFLADLTLIVRECFREDGIEYCGNGDPRELAALYFETRIRRIIPRPRKVHFSIEIHSSLGRLVRETDPDRKQKALEAWRAVFTLRDCFVNGEEVTRFLSKQVTKAAGKDGMLWDFGMHHFHLCRQLEDSETFVERSDYLLFAIIAENAAFFVDIRSHHDPEGLGWVRQELLRIAHSNWPVLLKCRELRGITGQTVTNQQKQLLRQRNLNHATELGGKAIAPIGWGVTAAGSSALCRVLGDRLIHEIKRHEEYFRGQPPEVRRALEESGAAVAQRIEFRLARIDSPSQSIEVLEGLRAHQGLSKDLCGMGFAVVEATTRTAVLVPDQ